LTAGASKTDAGIREVELLLALRDELAAKSPKEGPGNRGSSTGHGWFRTSDLSRVKRLRHSLRNPPYPCK
jgi:hypothetical protein